MRIYHDERKYIPFTNDLANGIYFRSLDNELTFEADRREISSGKLTSTASGYKSLIWLFYVEMVTYNFRSFI